MIELVNVFIHIEDIIDIFIIIILIIKKSI